VSRLQLAINVGDIDQAVEFYSKLFQSEPAKRRPGYANFAIADPPLKLVLFQNPGAPTINHLGVEVQSTTEVVDATKRLAGEGLATRVEDGVTCCHALQDKVWVDSPDGEPWEIYTVLADVPVDAPGCELTASGEAGECCQIFNAQAAAAQGKELLPVTSSDACC
jgi:catechol 2,3-dioxygenase-like lactoylglutathione lyase family enzyme